MRTGIFLAALALAAAPCCAAADTVLLKNGDRLSGEVVDLGNGRLTVRTPYADSIELDWDEVERVEGEVAVADEKEAGTAYSGRAALAASYVRGNAESERFYGDGELTARAPRYRYTLSGKAERRNEPLAGTSVAWLAAANYDRFVAEKRFVYVRGSLEHDRVKDIEQRAALGAGYGAQLLESRRASVSLRGGLDYVSVDRQLAGDERYPALGWALKAEAAPWGERLRLFHEHEGFWNLEDTARLFVRSKSGLRLPLVARLSATAQINVDWERRPAPGRKSTDTTLLLGLDYAW
ncbi:MAG TPA: DUF481 domain-containing protein [Burkholderiales bacterium]